MQGKLYALDARTGKIVWQTWISDPPSRTRASMATTGGVIVTHGKVPSSA